MASSQELLLQQGHQQLTEGLRAAAAWAMQAEDAALATRLTKIGRLAEAIADLQSYAAVELVPIATGVPQIPEQASEQFVAPLPVQEELEPTALPEAAAVQEPDEPPAEQDSDVTQEFSARAQRFIATQPPRTRELVKYVLSRPGVKMTTRELIDLAPGASDSARRQRVYVFLSSFKASELGQEILRQSGRPKSKDYRFWIDKAADLFADAPEPTPQQSPDVPPIVVQETPAVEVVASTVTEWGLEMYGIGQKRFKFDGQRFVLRPAAATVLAQVLQHPEGIEFTALLDALNTDGRGFNNDSLQSSLRELKQEFEKVGHAEKWIDRLDMLDKGSERLLCVSQAQPLSEESDFLAQA